MRAVEGTTRAARRRKRTVVGMVTLFKKRPLHQRLLNSKHHQQDQIQPQRPGRGTDSLSIANNTPATPPITPTKSHIYPPHPPRFRPAQSVPHSAASPPPPPTGPPPPPPLARRQQLAPPRLPIPHPTNAGTPVSRTRIMSASCISPEVYEQAGRQHSFIRYLTVGYMPSVLVRVRSRLWLCLW